MCALLRCLGVYQNQISRNGELNALEVAQCREVPLRDIVGVGYLLP